MKEIRIAAMCRTGQHGIIAWMKAQLEKAGESVHFENDVGVRFGLNKKMAIHDYPEASVLMYNYEDPDLKSLHDASKEQELREDVEYKDVLIMRDPFNQFASRLKYSYSSIIKRSWKDSKIQENFIQMWKNHAREFLGQTQHLTRNPVCISFNKWFSDIEYRRALSESLKIPFSDEGLDIHGTESSFDNIKVQTPGARKMTVLYRWRDVQNESIYRKIFQDKELIRLSNLIFDGFSEAKKELIDAI